MIREHLNSECRGVEGFCNITAGEYQDAKQWLFTLKQAEQAQVRAALQIINDLNLSTTTVVTGPSIYPGKIPMMKVPLSDVPATSYLWQPDKKEIARVRGSYHCLDLSVLIDPASVSETSVAKAFENQLMTRTVEKRSIGSHVLYFQTKGVERLSNDPVFDMHFNWMGQRFQYERSDGLSGYVAVSVIKDNQLPKNSLVLARSKSLLAIAA